MSLDSLCLSFASFSFPVYNNDPIISKSKSGSCIVARRQSHGNQPTFLDDLMAPQILLLAGSTGWQMCFVDISACVIRYIACYFSWWSVTKNFRRQVVVVAQYTRKYDIHDATRMISDSTIAPL